MHLAWFFSSSSSSFFFPPLIKKNILPIFQVLLDTVGPELQVVNKTEHPVSLQADTLVVLTPDQEKEATSNLLPINFRGLAKV